MSSDILCIVVEEPKQKKSSPLKGTYRNIGAFLLRRINLNKEFFNSRRRYSGNKRIG